MATFRATYSVTIAGMSGNQTKKLSDVFSLRASSWGRDAIDEASDLITAKLKLPRQQRVLSVVFLTVEEQKPTSYYLAYVATISSIDGDRLRHGADFFDLQATTWSPQALDEAMNAIKGSLPYSDRYSVKDLTVTFVKECAA